MSGKTVLIEGLDSLDASSWKQNRAVHLPAGGAARPWLCRDFPRPLLVILPNSRQVRDFYSDSAALGRAGTGAVISRVEMLTELAITTVADDRALYEAQLAERGEALARWHDFGGVLAATPGALMGPISTGGDRLELVTGDTATRSGLIQWLTDKGYERTDIVWSPGQYTYRGGIVDFFDPKESHPARVEFFDDDIESMRFFVTDTQRSVRNISRIEIHALSSRKGATLDKFFRPDMHVMFVEPSDLENSADNYAWLASAQEGERALVAGWNDVQKMLSLYPRIRVTADIAKCDLSSGIMGLPNFRGRRRDLEVYGEQLKSRGTRFYLISENERSREWAQERAYRAADGIISEGFLDTAANIALIGDLELSGLSLTGSSAERAVPLDWGDRLTVGQWVVHDDYGVARYMGSEQIETADGVQEYLVLEYAEERRLKIPVMHFHKIAPYRTYPGMEPVADSLRGGQWKKMSKRAAEQAAQAAVFLVDVYAKREITPGYSFKPDRESERQFESTFPYKETTDQIRAIDDVLRDMERPIPMDRLLVGDVGFGKTEVAMRAAARAVFDGKQVVMMAPTTLLAQQHYETFSARFDQMGVRVEVLSRFVSPSRQKAILGDASEGKVDILLGTHRLLSGDIKLRDLGLVIIDEEHRFGVLHKEHLKNLHPNVDVLMLSATPIPRSLHLSLSGLRDLSLLQTPPRKRLPVITAVGVWSEHLVKSAVLREVGRGGQIFYVHNRVQSIDAEALMVKRLFPKLRVAVAHGQMPEKQLKATMDKFERSEVDILVCTTIVESGLDIPRANTLIVSDAQELGLAQMHQLRGRVGRRDVQAFALFLHPAEIKLTKEAGERLEAIAALGEFGAGYELAKKDLEIRGGGELVGIAQHGSLGRVGFQRYCDLLEEAIARIKGDYRQRTEVEVGIPSAIPKDYLPQEGVRVALYRKLLWSQNAETLTALKEETKDRFGPLPKVLSFLFDVAEVKATGANYGIIKVLCGRDETVILCDPEGPTKDMKIPVGWFRRLDGFIGPGGLSSLGFFLDSLRLGAGPWDSVPNPARGRSPLDP